MIIVSLTQNEPQDLSSTDTIYFAAEIFGKMNVKLFDCWVVITPLRVFFIE